MEGLVLLALLSVGIVYVSLALLPPGRTAAFGLGVAVLIAAVYWRATGDDLTALFAATGILLAAIAQGVRLALAGTLSFGVYLALLPAIALGVGALAFAILGP